MAKVSDEAKKLYFERISEYKKKIDELLEKENQILKMIQPDDVAKGYKKMLLADDNLNMISYFLLINNISFALLGVKNEGALNDARKICYKSIIYLEEIFTDLIDVPYSDYEAGVLSVADFPELNKYKLIRKMGFCVQSISDAYGDNSKWKWSFVEMEGRVTTLAKNCMNLKQIVSGMDPRIEGYRERALYFNLVRELLDKSAEGYRLKYELSTNRMDDFRLAINYLSALKRLLSLTNRIKEIEDLTRKIDIWKQKMDKDLKIREKKALMDKLAPPKA
jgi:hypothetical protein